VATATVHDNPCATDPGSLSSGEPGWQSDPGTNPSRYSHYSLDLRRGQSGCTRTVRPWGGRPAPSFT
jgi:hypothetical protein